MIRIVGALIFSLFAATFASVGLAEPPKETGANLVPIIGLLLLDSDDEVVALNNAPIASVSANQSVLVGSSVTVSGSESIDPDGDALVYSWSGTGPVGTQAVLTSTSGVSTSFVPDLPGTYVIQLIVNDGNLDSEPAAITITAELTGGTNLYPVVVSREASDIYRVQGEDTYIFTRFCFEFVFFDDAVLHGNSYIEFEDGTTCDIEGVYRKYLLGSGLYSVTVTREESNWYSILNDSGLINTQFCFEFVFFDNAALTIGFFGTGTLAFSNGGTCNVLAYYEKLIL